MKTAFAKPPNRSQSYTKFATPLVLESPRHCGLGAILLSRGKHLLGTASDCTISLRASDVQSRHALIVVSEHRTVVKALDPRTWVNDGPVSEMALRPGDRLSIGPLTFRVRAADAEELASFDEIPEHAFSEDFLLEPTSKFESSANTGTHLETTRELPLPIINTTELAKSVASAMPQPTPVDNSSTPLPPAMPARDVLPVAEIKVAEIKLVPTPLPPPLPTTMEPAANLLPPSEFAPVANLADSKESQSHDGPGDENASTETLDLKLDEIQRTLSELQRPMELPPNTTDSDNAVRAEALTVERRQFNVRQDELQRRAEELARQSQLLRERVARVAEREVEVERSLTRLALEHEQLATAAEVTRKELDDEYARHMALWQEWDAAYRRTSGELNGQLQSMEQRRTALLAEGDRLAGERSELQRLQAEHERDRRIHAAERVQLTTDRAALQSLRAEFDTERQQHLVAVQEREARVAAERTALVGTQEELLATRQQLERERSEFLAVRSTEALRREQELREHVERREQLDTDHARIQTRSLELNELERVLDAERSALATQRDEFARQQSGIDADREELSRLRSRLHTTAATLLQLQRERDDFQLAAARSFESSPQNHVENRQERSNEHAGGPALPPPIPTNRGEDATNIVGMIGEPTLASDFAEFGPVTYAPVASRNASNGLETSQDDALSMIVDTVPPNMESAGEFRSDSTIQVSEYEQAPAPALVPALAPAAASTNRFWEDSTLYDTSLGGSSQPVSPSHFTASSNLMMSAQAASSQESVPTDEAPAKPSLEELLANLGRSIASASGVSQPMAEAEPDADSSSKVDTATAIAEPPLNADETLAEINRQFGIPVTPPSDEAEQEPQKPALPSWWNDSTPAAGTHTHKSAVVETTDSASSDRHSDAFETQPQERESPPAVTSESANSDPLHSLRSQLAQMFDLPASDRGLNRETESVNQGDLDQSGFQSEQASPEVVEELEMSRRISQPAEATEPEPPADSSADHDEQRPIGSNTTTAVEASATTESVESESATETETAAGVADEEEDSMETYLARLLSRSRGTDVSAHEVKSLTTKSTRTTSTSDGPTSDDPKPMAAFDPADRSHLTAEPKHKQDRQAAREDLQQFRQVAHQSARSALARHTSKALLSAVIAKSMLLGISVTALCVYAGAPLMGLATPSWKGVACTFTTGLCIMEVHRSWRQLYSWKKTGEFPVKKVSPTQPTTAPASDVAFVAVKTEPQSAPVSAS